MWERRDCRDTDAPPTLAGVVQDSSAILAANDLPSRLYLHGRGGRHFHVATGANFVLERDDRSVTLTRKQPIEAT